MMLNVQSLKTFLTRTMRGYKYTTETSDEIKREDVPPTKSQEMEIKTKKKGKRNMSIYANKILTLSGGEQVQEIFVTPELANAFLSCNHPNNRAFKENDIKKYVREMDNNRWLMTGETIVFSGKGYLIDGQNRLKAIAASGKGQRMLVVRGVSDEAIRLINSGVPRTLRDQFMISGKTDAIYTNRKSTALVRLLAFDTGLISWKDKQSVSEIEQLIDKYSNLCRFTIAYSGKGALPSVATEYAILKVLANGAKEQLVRAFIKCFATNTIDKDITDVNWKPVIDLKQDYREGKFFTGGFVNQMETVDRTLKAFYLFSNNIGKTTRNPSELYPVTEVSLKKLNDSFKCGSFKEPWFGD